MTLFIVLASILFAGAVACGQPRRPGLDRSDTIGANAEVGQVKLRNVFVEPPADGEFRPGDDAVVRLAMINDAPRPDTLVRVETDAARAVIMRWDRTCNGNVETVSRIPLLAEGTVPGAQPDQAGLASPFYLELDGLTRRVLEGTTLPVRFTFEHAGSVTVDAMVRAGRDLIELPPRGCVRTTVSGTAAAR
jgi:copper(I)-binding protein